MGTDTRNQFEIFCEGYIGKVHAEYSGLIESMQNMKERKTLAVNRDRQLVTKASTNVAASGANNGEQLAQLITTLAQLAKTEADVTEAKDSLESLQTEKEKKEAGARDPENMDWIRNIKLIDKNNAAAAAAFKAELQKKLNSLSEA